MLYFVTYPDWEGHWHKNCNLAVTSELQRLGLDFVKVILDHRSQGGRRALEHLTALTTTQTDVWLFSVAQSPAVELVGSKPGAKFAHVHGMTCFPFDPAVLQGIDLREKRRFGYYDRLFVSSRWSYQNAVAHYPEYAEKFAYTGFPIDFEDYQPYRGRRKRKKLIVFNQRFSCERLPLIEIELAGILSGEGFDVQHLYAPVKGRISNGCRHLKRLRSIGESCGLNFVPNLSKDDYHRSLAQASVVVTTSICDNLPVSLIEGIHLGAVPVAPESMCFGEIVHRDNLYSPYDLKGIVRICQSQPQREHPIYRHAKKRVVGQYLEHMDLQ